MGVQRHTPAAGRPGTEIRYPLYGRRGLSGACTENLDPTGIRSPDPPGSSESLCRLSYPGPYITSLTKVLFVTIRDYYYYYYYYYFFFFVFFFSSSLFFFFSFFFFSVLFFFFFFLCFFSFFFSFFFFSSSSSSFFSSLFFFSFFFFFFFFFSRRYNPWWALACFTILFHNLLSLHFSLQFLTFIFFRSSSTWSSHLSLGLPTGLDEHGSHSVSFF